MPYNPDYKISLSLYLIRHGNSKANAGTSGDSIEEREDPVLTGLGLRQARLLGERFSKRPMDCVISSPLKRSIETALPIAALQPDGGAKSVEINPLFCEAGLSEDYEGKTLSEIKSMYPFVSAAPDCQNRDRLIIHTKNGAASKDRAKKAIDYLTSRFHSGESVALVSHGGFNRYLLEAAMNIDFEQAKSDPTFFNAGVTKINFFENGEGIYGNDVVLVYMNDHSHLMNEMPDLTFDKT